MVQILAMVKLYALFVCLLASAREAVSFDTECGAGSWPVPPAPPGYTLKQVNVVIRHGDRTPWSGDTCWPDDSSVWDCQLTSGEVPMLSDYQYGNLLPRIYRKIYSFGNETLRGNCTVAQLTSLGFSQHISNGQNLAKAYVDSRFLSKTLNTTEIYLRSDDTSRTLMSAQSLLLGMYPPPPSRTVTSTQTVEMHTMDRTYDYMVPNPRLCPRYGNWSRTFNQSSAWRQHHPQTLALLADIKNQTGFTLAEEDLEHFSDCLRTHYCHQLGWPKGVTRDLYNRVWAEVTWQFYQLYRFPSIPDNSRTGIGFLLKELWQNMNALVTGRPKQKFLLYSGHDTTLMPLLTALQVDEGVWPPYASMLLLELYVDTSGGFFVRILYNGKVLKPPFCKTEGFCRYVELAQYLMTVCPPNDYTSLCAIPSKKSPNMWNF